MNDARTTRPPPQVIHVPPPRGMDPKVIALVVISVIVISLGFGVMALGYSFPSWPMAVGGLVTAGLGFAVWCAARTEIHLKELHRVYLAELRRRGVDTVVLDIAQRWKTRGNRPWSESVRQVVVSHSSTEHSRAHVVCLGKVHVPQVGEYFFEPEVITPTRAVGRQLLVVPFAVVVVAVWLMQEYGVIPGESLSVGCLGGVLYWAVAVGVVWMWLTVLRPSYVRMAPGVIQVLEYRYRRAKPLIRSYPMDAETIAILRGEYTPGKTYALTLTLLRAEQKDTIKLWRMRKRDQAIERMWHALLSTAPTPPLSDEELVG